MVQGYDKTEPVHGGELDSDPIRENFNALATHHSGPTAPASPDPGYTWLDTTTREIKVFVEGIGWSVSAKFDATGKMLVDGGPF